MFPFLWSFKFIIKNIDSYSALHISSVKNEFINSVHIVTYILLFNKIIYDKYKYLKL